MINQSWKELSVKLVDHVLDNLKNIDSNYLYHNVNHTINVVNYTHEIANNSSVSDNDLKLLSTAALLHDYGFVQSHIDHEKIGAKLSADILLKFDYKIDDVFKAWSAGCILQGNYLNFISQKYKTDKTLNFEFLFNLIEEKCSNKLRSIREFNSNAIKFGLPCPVLSSNLAYYDLIFSKHKIGETIQLQRSFFGLHPIKDKKSNNKIKPYWTKL